MGRELIAVDYAVHDILYFHESVVFGD